jgi:CRP-like cAMP-binding protein
MNAEPGSNLFHIWGLDDAAYGPVELPTLVNWIQDGRVLAETWIYAQRNTTWQRAADLPELRMFFGARPPEGTSGSTPAFKPGALRRVKILASLTDEQLARFTQFMEIAKAPQWSTLVTQGEDGDAMYLILEGELRARLLVGGRESILATLGPGDFFGEISLFDHGLRSADIIANKDSFLLKISAAACQALANEAPDIATVFLLGVARTLAARIRADNRRFSQSVTFAQAAGI